ncbi:MAG: hypothetical protein IJE07_02455 [Clostridia bacterium]|nr:hypothetical protein [Clostridia bacterium]
MKRFTTPGAIVALLSALISLAAGIFFQVTNGTFGQGKVQSYYNPVLFGLLIAAIVVVVLLLIFKLPGLASFAATLIPGIGIALFFLGGNGARAAYWHFADLGFEEKSFGMCPKFLTFLMLMVVAFIVGEISVYLRKNPKLKG